MPEVFIMGQSQEVNYIAGMNLRSWNVHKTFCEDICHQQHMYKSRKMEDLQPMTKGFKYISVGGKCIF